MTAAFWMIALVIAIGRLGMEMFYPALPTLQAYLSESVFSVELTITIYLVGFTLSQFIGGILSDYVGRKKVFLLGILCYIVGSVLCFTSGNAYIFLLSRLLMGFGIGVGPSVGRAILSDQYSSTKLIGLIATLSNVLVISSFVGPIIAGWLLSFAGWQSITLFLVVLGIISFIGTLTSVGETRDISKHNTYSRTHLTKAMRELFQDKLFVGVTLMNGIAFGIMMGFGKVASITIIEGMGYSPVLFGWIMAGVALSYLLGGVVAKRLNKKMTPKSILALSFYVITVTASLTTLLLNYQVTIGAYILPIIVIFAFCRVIVPVCSALSVSNKAQSGLASSFFGVGYLGMSSLISFLFAVALSGSPVSLYITFVVLGLCGLAILRWSYQEKSSMEKIENSSLSK